MKRSVKSRIGKVTRLSSFKSRVERSTPMIGVEKEKIVTLETGLNFSSIPQSAYATAESSER